uniref:FA complementation group L n=1 Tax=Zosterops lateralis melanops TaxID=1220523 RepID=A0A8D2P942_ZOSLA
TLNMTLKAVLKYCFLPLFVSFSQEKLLCCCVIECGWSLKRILHGYRHILKQRLHSCPDLVSFMVELKTVLEIALKNAQDLHIPRPPEYYSCLVRDLEILGWKRVAFVDTGLTTVKLKAEDSCGRQHLITLKLNAKYPTEPPGCLVDFPVPFAVSWMPQNSLIDIYNQFLAALELLKEFWDALDEIDGKTWVLEPENPTRSATTRRIAIGGKRFKGIYEYRGRSSPSKHASRMLFPWSRSCEPSEN